MNKFKIGDKVKLTPDRFRAFNMKQGVTNPNVKYMVMRINEQGALLLNEIANQWHNESDLSLIPKSVVIIRRSNGLT